MESQPEAQVPLSCSVSSSEPDEVPRTVASHMTRKAVGRIMSALAHFMPACSLALLLTACAAQPPTAPIVSSHAVGATAPEATVRQVLEAITAIERNYIERSDRQVLVDACLQALSTRDTEPESRARVAAGNLKDLAAKFGRLAPQDAEAAADACILAMVATLDRHSTYLTQAEFREIKPGSDPVGGIGLELAPTADGVSVVAPFEGGPAACAGIARGDFIMAVNDVDLRGRSLKEISSLLRGAPGSSLTVTVQRIGRSEPLRFDVKREVIRMQSVHGRLLGPGIAYLALSQFQETTPGRLAAVMSNLRQQNAAALSGIILDLRWSTGGLLNTAVAVSAAFLPRGELVADMRGRTEENTRRLYAEPSYFVRAGSSDPFAALPLEVKSVPLVVLVGPVTSAGAEIVASALQDHKRAVVVGARSSGKGTIETILPLPLNTALRLTTARVFRPSGKLVDGNGVEPDIVVEPSAPIGNGIPPSAYPTSKELGALDDPAVAKALSILQSKKVHAGVPKLFDLTGCCVSLME
jgi:carboxyl-terminal processing protease